VLSCLVPDGYSAVVGIVKLPTSSDPDANYKTEPQNGQDRRNALASHLMPVGHNERVPRPAASELIRRNHFNHYGASAEYGHLIFTSAQDKAVTPGPVITIAQQRDRWHRV